MRSARLSWLAGIPAIAVVTWLAYGKGYVNHDAMWSLVWGDQIAHLQLPDYKAVGASTPHPLTNLVGVVLSPLGADAEPVLHAIGYLAIGALAYAVGLLALTLFGKAAAIVAVALVLSRGTVTTAGANAYLDVAYTALVTLALAIEARPPRRDRRVLMVLAVAGLLRPEGWLLAGMYWLYLAARAGPHERPWSLLTAVLAAPLLWALADLAAAGDPFFSFTYTRDEAAALGRSTGLNDLVTLGPHILVDELRSPVALVAAVGFLLTCMARGGRLLAAGVVATGVAFSIPVIAGTVLIGRYLLPTTTLLCVFAAAALTAWLRPTAGHRLVLGAAAAVCAAVLIAKVPDEVDGFRAQREHLVVATATRASARDVVRDGLDCLPVTTVNNGMTPLVAVWAGVPSRQIFDGRVDPPPSGSVLWAPRKVLEQWILPKGGNAPMAARPSGRVVREVNGWTLTDRCRPST